MLADEMMKRFTDLLGEHGWVFKLDPPKNTRGNSLMPYGTLEARGVRTGLQILPQRGPITPDAEILEQINSQYRGQSVQLLLVAEIRSSLSQFLRNAQVNFADMHGNIYLQAPGLFIDIRGRRTDKKNWPETIRAVGREKKRVDLYSPIRAQVLFALITWPDLFSAPIREIARAAGTSLGAAQEVVSSLRDQHDDLHPFVLSNLFQGWIASYPDRLLPKLEIARFEAISPHTVGGEGVVLSGESALPDLVRPATITLYTDELRPSLIKVNRWRKSSSPNVYVRRKFWKEPGQETGWSTHQNAPSTLIYADLIITGDPRLKEVAHEFAQHDPQLLRLGVE